MSIDSIQNYQEALRKLDSARHKVDQLVIEITNGANSLRTWDQVVISNVNIGSLQKHMLNQ